MDQPALAAFLRSRRAGLRPEDVGLAAGPRRLVPGLRREEVAALAGMSADYYVRMEQARSPQPSEQMLSALARAIRLSSDERDYLYRLAGHNVPGRTPQDTHVSPALLRVFDRLEHTPALILSSLGETLAQNRLGAALLGDHSRHTGLAGSSVYRWFTDPAEREIYPVTDRHRQSRAQASSLRVALGAAGPRSRASVLVRELHKVSPEFTEIWDLHEVASRFEDHKTLIHAELGPIDLDCQALFTEDQGQALLILTAAPRSEAAEKLELLAVLGQQTFSPAHDSR
ncbi:helix-turn-helix transcriptional regulator [Cryobacterium sp. PAMC25264]|uniref:helix-turn-helix transcriptional regulator n=1 Tax=Cryobacterium sp. PAMC25264 TaxID=2861288 RepID=UPI001C6349DF|nr:helix-turn-helix transcriptional regulator [Cryobacterium sp. PAMC25264]QYF74483.1 helix-turn-helix transcriptional regulator [Cryobacterium sp. PAMC25264]